MTLHYREFEILPTVGVEGIPDRSQDWTWVHKNYDSPTDQRIGTCASTEAAKRQIDQWWEEQDDAR